MSFVIHVPTGLGDKNLASFFHGWTWHDDPESPVEINITRGAHIAPWAATLFGAYGLWLKKVRGKEVFLNYEEDTYIGSFIERFGLASCTHTSFKFKVCAFNVASYRKRRSNGRETYS